MGQGGACRAVALLPIGLAHGVALLRDVAAGDMLSMADVALDEAIEAVKLRRAMLG